MPLTPPARVLLAEDDPELRRLLAGSLRGVEVEEVADGLALRKRLLCEPLPDLLITDNRMPGLTGLEVVQRMREDAAPLPPFVLLTAFGDPAVHELARRLGAVATLDKPFDIDELRALVSRTLSSDVSGP